MALTRANFESELVNRRSAMMSAAGLAITYAGANADLNGPIGYAIRQCGGTVASFASVADSDLSGFAETDYDKLFDLAEFRLLMNIKGRWGKVDIRSGPFSQSLSQLADQLDNDIAALKAQLTEMYGFGGGSIQVGVIDFNFQQTDPDAGL